MAIVVVALDAHGAMAIAKGARNAIRQRARQQQGMPEASGTWFHDRRERVGPAAHSECPRRSLESERPHGLSLRLRCPGIAARKALRR